MACVVSHPELASDMRRSSVSLVFHVDARIAFVRQIKVDRQIQQGPHGKGRLRQLPCEPVARQLATISSCTAAACSNWPIARSMRITWSASANGPAPCRANVAASWRAARARSSACARDQTAHSRFPYKQQRIARSVRGDDGLPSEWAMDEPARLRHQPRVARAFGENRSGPPQPSDTRSSQHRHVRFKPLVMECASPVSKRCRCQPSIAIA